MQQKVLHIHLLDETSKKNLKVKKVSKAPSVTKKGVLKKGHTQGYHVNDKSSANSFNKHEVDGNIKKAGESIDGMFEQFNTDFVDLVHESYTSGKLTKDEFRDVAAEVFQDFFTGANDNINNMQKSVEQNAKDNPSAKNDYMVDNLQKIIDPYIKNLMDVADRHGTLLKKVHMTDGLKVNDRVTNALLKGNTEATNSLLERSYKASAVFTNIINESSTDSLKRNLHSSNDIRDSNAHKVLSGINSTRKHSNNHLAFNSNLNKVFDKLTDNGKDYTLLSKISSQVDSGGSYTDQKTMKHLHEGTGEYFVDKNTVSKNLQHQADFGKFLESSEAKQQGQITYAQNPKKMLDFIEKAKGTSPRQDVPKMLSDQYNGSNGPHGAIIKRSLPDIMGIRDKDNLFIKPFIGREHGIYQQGSLDKSKVPAYMAKNLKAVHDITTDFLKKNPDYLANSSGGQTVSKANTIYRGLDIPLNSKAKRLELASGTSSTATRKSTSISFMTGYPQGKKYTVAGLKKTLGEHDLDMHFSKSQQDLIKNMQFSTDISSKENLKYRNSLGTLIEFDAKKLEKNKRIFAFLDGKGFTHLNKQLQSQGFPSIHKNFNETEIMAII